MLDEFIFIVYYLPMNNEFDSAYKYLFSNKKIFHELITSFIDEPFIKNIKLEDIEPVDKTFVTDEFLQRESDIIYKVQMGDDEIYIYILLEFQSTVDKTIPLRMLLYITQFYDLIYRNSQRGNLPNVFPVLLYNGVDNWTIPDKLSDLIETNIPDRYIPKFEYYKIIEKDIPDEVLLNIHNLASAIILLEKNRDSAGLKVAVKQIVQLIKDENIVDVRMFTKWFKRMFRRNIDESIIESINNVTEVRNMITLLADNIKEEGKIEGILEGKLEGIEIGKSKGKLEGMVEYAYNMYLDGFTFEQISKYTGLSAKELESLVNKKQ